MDVCGYIRLRGLVDTRSRVFSILPKGYAYGDWHTKILNMPTFLRFQDRIMTRGKGSLENALRSVSELGPNRVLSGGVLCPQRISRLGSERPLESSVILGRLPKKNVRTLYANPNLSSPYSALSRGHANLGSTMTGEATILS